MDLLAQTSNGSGISSLLVPAILLAGMYVLLIRPQRARQRAQQAMLADLAVGDEVMTAGGIFGKVARIDEGTGRIGLLVAPGVEVEVLRIAVRERIAPLTPEP
jgi:preprotein translocase subunit YajC